MHRLIALDIDSTLFNDEHQIMMETKAALIKAQQNGAVLVLASGRPVAGLTTVARELEMEKYHGILLGYNGGMAVDYTSGEKIYEQTFEIDLARRFLQHLEKYPVTPIVDDGACIYTENPEGFRIQYESGVGNLDVKKVTRLSEEIHFAPPKILVAALAERMKAHKEDITTPFETDMDFTLSTPYYLETTPKGVHKGASLEKICRTLDVEPENVVAFGDGENDISMLSFAGLGVAMGNACPALKAMADMVTLSNNENGIAAFLSM